MKSLFFLYRVRNIIKGRSTIIEEINTILALLLTIMLVPVLVTAITLLLRKRRIIEATAN